jgi:uncharacterized protein YegL
LSLVSRLESAVEFAENPEPRCPCVLLLDTSGSMAGARLDAMLQGLEAFRFDVSVDPLAARRVEVAVVTFDDQVNIVQDFVSPDRFQVPYVTAQGMTKMGEGLHAALDLVERRKATYRAHDVGYYRPWVFLVTDGEPQGEPEQVIDMARRRVRDVEEHKQAAIFGVGVEGANLAKLGDLLVRPPLKLKGLDFREMFLWLSRSMQSVANSRPDDRIMLPPTGWAEL